ncbi:MAG: XRE family transcriptional regulator [Acidobacteria bacterium]|nr:MAG: XRE family transcriptional regulator [Acidobacteriota bacterium]
MSGLEFKSPAELQIELGKRLRRLRLQRNIDQRTLAEKAGVALTALQKLEAGRGSTVRTLVRTLKALNYLEGIEMLAPEPTVNPLALLRSTKPRQRVSRSRLLNKPRKKSS